MKDNDTIYAPGWDYVRVRRATKAKFGYWTDTIYNTKQIADHIHREREMQDSLMSSLHRHGADNGTQRPISEFDTNIWDSLMVILEGGRQFVFDTCIEYGVSEVESHFLSIRWARSTLKKFRGILYRAFVNTSGSDENLDEREEYNSTSLRTALYVQITKFDRIEAPDNFEWSSEGSSTSTFRKEAGKHIAQKMADETGAIMHAKLVL